MTLSTDGPEIIELQDEKQRRERQVFLLPGLPEMISAMHVCHAVRAIAEAPLPERLRNAPRRPDDGLPAGLDPDIGAGFLRHLVNRGVLETRGDEFFLTRLGEFLTTDVSLARLGVHLGAYGGVTSRIGDLTGKAVHGTDVTRDGGQLIVDACLRDPSLTGTGPDIDANVIAVANDLARRHGVSDRVEFVAADAFAPKTRPEVCAEADGLCMMSALHEHFRKDEQAVVDLPNEVSAKFPQQKVLLIGESEIRHDGRKNDDDFLLIHVLTGQGLPRDRAAWLPDRGGAARRCGRDRRADCGTPGARAVAVLPQPPSTPLRLRRNTPVPTRPATAQIPRNRPGPKRGSTPPGVMLAVRS
ncbi:SAM-dependent methyltransferase [Streptomyces desertarenae]|uniref:SAM-dependent methyltransferase n=1 Tax=Streptomyces desertarenae TaxID=2666184 RepID=A0ABW4PM63_9ACTN